MSCLSISCQSTLCLPGNEWPRFSKWGKTAVTASALALLVLGAAYVVCGYTPLLQNPFFTPLHTLGIPGLSIVLTVVTAAALITLSILIYIRLKKSGPFVTPAVLQEFDRLANTLKFPEDSRLSVKNFLAKGYDTYLEHYTFYHHLRTLSTKIVHDHPSQKENWQTFLQSIHGVKIDNDLLDKGTTIDCTYEYMYLNGQVVDTKIERLGHTIRENDLRAILNIRYEAFDSCRTYSIPDWLASERDTVYVMRDVSSNEILAMIDLVIDKKKNTVVFWNLAAKPNAVNLHMAEKFLQLMEEQKFSKTSCSVYQQNKPAQLIYQKFGLLIVDVPQENVYRMERVGSLSEHLAHLKAIGALRL